MTTPRAEATITAGLRAIADGYPESVPATTLRALYRRDLVAYDHDAPPGRPLLVLTDTGTQRLRVARGGPSEAVQE